MILNLDKALKKRADRKEPKFFWAIDLHRTIVYPTYDNNAELTFYPYAEETLKLINSLPNHIMILFTSTHDIEVQRILEFFEKRDICFKYINENPDCPTTALCNFDKKFYFDALIDDKSGFNPENDWHYVNNAIQYFQGTTIL